MKTLHKIDKLLENYQSDDCTLKEKIALERELQNDDLRNEWFEQHWAKASHEVSDETEDRMWMEINKEQEAVRSLFVQRYMKVCAVLLLMISSSYLTVLMLRDNNITQDVIMLVENGEKASLILPDGSRIWANSATKIIYSTDYDQKERRIELYGEAFFDVVSNPEVPFVVNVKDQMEVKALGTSFNIKAYDDTDISTTLISGKVEVTASGETTVLLPNSSIHYNALADVLFVNKSVDENGVLAWKNGIFSFEQSSFMEVTQQLTRHFDIRFTFLDDRLKQYRFTGEISSSNLEDVLEVMSLTSPLRYHIKDTVVILGLDGAKIDQYEQLVNK